jgi:outer membrane protein OmpA-like peptidoglycan-associated protein
MSYSYDTSEHDGDESYFVSMTDIMVGMLFVFIILLMFFVFRIQNTSERMIPLSEHEAVLKQRDDAFRRIAELEKEIVRLNANPLEKYLKAADATRENILQNLKSSMEDVLGVHSGDIKVIPEQGILRLSGDMLFPKGISAVLPGSPGEKAIKALAGALVRVIPCFSLGPESNAIKSCNPNAAFIDAIFVEGHTDNTPITAILEGYVTDNLALSLRRAMNTANAIYGSQPSLKGMYSISPSQVGLELGQGTSSLINPAGFGDTRPALSNDTEDGKKGNRRIDLRILMYSPRTESLDSVRKLLKP